MQQTPYPSAQVPEPFPFFDSHSDLHIVNKIILDFLKLNTVNEMFLGCVICSVTLIKLS